MKIQTLIVENIGMITDAEIEFDKPLNIFYGEIMQGKTTLLNAVKLCFGGAFPKDIITRGQESGHVKIVFDSGYIERSFYKNKDGDTISRPLEFVKDGEIIKKPIEKIKKFINPFLLDQNFLINKNEAERTAYFVELFGIDNSELDSKIFKLDEEAKELRIRIKHFGTAVPEKVEKPNVEPLNEQKEKIDDQNEEWEGTFERALDAYDGEVVRWNKTQENKAVSEQRLKINEESIQKFNEAIAKIEKENKQIRDWFEKHKTNLKPERPAEPDYISTIDIDKEIEASREQAFQYRAYQAALEKLEEKTELEVHLKKLTADKSKLSKEKSAKLKEISDNSKIKDLSFSEDGSFMYMETTAGMLSTSQLMTLSSQLADLYPEGMGIELIDRAESLGKSIFEFISKAEEENKTILAAIVGEAPATIPENVGVFVVDKGKTKKTNLTKGFTNVKNTRQRNNRKTSGHLKRKRKVGLRSEGREPCSANRNEDGRT